MSSSTPLVRIPSWVESMPSAWAPSREVTRLAGLLLYIFPSQE